MLYNPRESQNYPCPCKEGQHMPALLKGHWSCRWFLSQNTLSFRTLLSWNSPDVFFFSYGAKKPGCRFASNLPWNEPFWKHTLGPRLTQGNRRTVFWAGLEIPCQQQHLTNFQLVMNDNGLNKNIAQKNVKMENVRAQKIKINSTVHWLQTWKKPKHQACRK